MLLKQRKGPRPEHQRVYLKYTFFMTSEINVRSIGYEPDSSVCSSEIYHH
ncbi:hypothetical protein VIBNISOn1_30079 [Vibrio nigripulchritudo SOn1]|uniref:Uncharacterized protein n=1 Tax=Vibrio nigripulchritudo SOn1 TaxID=1238450 RepID=A0AAV2VRY8_9VIBR|nr:hypothetical protein VIBNISOn1_30079 [Vibrio nigripulchritudo SOn1]